MPDLDLWSLTTEEKDAVIDEMAERLRDLIAFRSDEIAKNWFDRARDLGTLIGPEMKIELIYTVTMVGMDIMQIVGRLRRK